MDKFELDKTPGLNIAFGITHYDNNTEPLDDLDYGEVVAMVKTWNSTEGIRYRKIPMRQCT